MAVAQRMQRIKMVTAAAICMLLIVLVSTAWSMGQVAVAEAAPDMVVKNGESGGILIAWNEGKTTLEHITSLSAENPQVTAILDDLPGGLETLQEGRWLAPSIQAVDLPDGTPLDEALERFSSLPGVRYVEPDAVMSADATKLDPYYSNQWFLSRIGVEKVWDVEKGSGDLAVAVLDTGVDGSHPDLAGRVLKGYNFVGENGNTNDVYGHGTHVAGIIGASGDNGTGVAGLAWRVKILPVKVLSDDGCGNYSDLIAGIRYAADNGASVINMSLGGGARSQALQEALDYARSKGTVLVAAAGNDALNTLSYPAACEGVISVGATDEQDRLVSFSNRGEGLDLVAPGTSIYSDVPGGRYAYKSGTSMSTPQVSGAFALLRSREPGLGVAQAEQRILSSACDLGPSGYDTSYGWGLLKADKALGLDKETPGNQSNNGGNLFFAEGYTGDGFDTYILLENPGTQSSEAHMELFGAQGMAAALDVEVASQARLTLRLNDLVPPGDVAARISVPEGSEIVAQRSMYFDYQGIGGGHTSRACTASKTWYFAEGYTGPGYDTYLLIFNPQQESANVDLSMITNAGVVHSSINVPPLARRTMRLNDTLPGVEMAMAIASDQPVVAERAMYFNSDGRDDGSVAAGATALSEEWYFAEGYTGGEFDEWLLLANPSSSMVTAAATFQRSDGVIVERDLELQPFSRATIHVDDVAGLADAEVSATVKASSPGVVVERSMYFTCSSSMGTINGGHTAGGATTPASHWLIPEGYTGSGFESWILISNLEDEVVNVEVDIFGESGAKVRREYRVGAHSRFTVKENDLLPGEGVSAEVSAPDGTSLVVEGSFYFRYRDGVDGGST